MPVYHQVYMPGYTTLGTPRSVLSRTCRTAARDGEWSLTALTLRVAETNISDEPLTVPTTRFTVGHPSHPFHCWTTSARSPR